VDKQRILNVSIAATALATGLALALVIVVVWLLGGLLPVAYGGVVEILLFAAAAGGMAFGLRQLVRKFVVPRMFEPGPVDPEILQEYREYRSQVMLVWWIGLALGISALAFPLELIRPGSAFALIAAVLVVSREKALVEYYLLKTEE
jgi:hypothetical protein